MHILGIMFFLAVLAVAIGVIFTMIVEYQERIVDALMGSSMSSHAEIVVIKLQPTKPRTGRVKPASNEDFNLALAA